MLKFNEEYIKEFEYSSVLNNKGTLDKLKNNYLNRYTSDKTEVTQLLLKESLDHYILKMLTCNPEFINSKEMQNYITYICQIYNVSKTEFNTNVVFKNDNIREKVINRYLPHHKNKIDYVRNDNYNLLQQIIKKITNKSSINQTEFNFVCEYLANLNEPELPVNQTLIKFIFGDMVNTNLKLSYQAQSFVLMFMPYIYSDKKARNVRLALGNTDRGIDIKGPGHSSFSGNYVALNKKVFENINLKSIDDSKVERLKQGNDFTFFMIVVFHELTHQIQKEYSKLSNYNDQGMSYIIHVLTNQELNDYKVNHDSDSMEIDANKHGWENCNIFFKNFCSRPDKEILLSNTYVNSNASSIRRTFAYKKDKNGEYIPYDQYDILNLVSIIHKNPSYINKFPMLQHFFNKEGKLKLDFITKFDLYTKETAMEFVNYFYKFNGVNQMIGYLDKRKFYDNEITHLINNLYYYIVQNLRKKENLNYVIYHNNAGEYNNNEKFDNSVAIKLGNMHFKNAYQAYNSIFPLFIKISKLYPNSKEYIDWIIEKLNKKFNINLGYSNSGGSHKI